MTTLQVEARLEWIKDHQRQIRRANDEAREVSD